jgi:hypothetical protein
MLAYGLKPPDLCNTVNCEGFIAHITRRREMSYLIYTQCLHYVIGYNLRCIGKIGYCNVGIEIDCLFSVSICIE